MMNLKTSQKIFLATILHHIVLGYRRVLGKGSKTTVIRDGIQWGLDLDEGIDFAIYLFGRFEPGTIKLYNKCVKRGDIVLDIGANIGAHTLPLALNVGNTGRVYAFEPTRFAYSKLEKNIQLNPQLKESITAYQIMLVASPDDRVDPSIYSSWPLDGNNKDLHDKHRGRLMKTDGAISKTLDTWAEESGISHLDFIKIDVDGHEFSVLNGGKTILKKYKPIVIMELAPYVFTNPSDFNNLIQLFNDFDYEIIDTDTKKKIRADPHELRKNIPDGSSRNVLLRRR